MSSHYAHCVSIDLSTGSKQQMKSSCYSSFVKHYTDTQVYIIHVLFLIFFLELALNKVGLDLFRLKFLLGVLFYLRFLCVSY